ncbi:uncharacterized protein LOC113094272 isoform X3 [Carassius auratus]|uniref:Uncharacterized protein LOC113094272 isoform X3 n=1 Tax=Carassius auratus TaxID=7957 RepID=A0A6P6P4W3_CARAU|nr:uncharacterized protein LOC113094272 isoform X3 [Carassius auratus]
MSSYWAKRRRILKGVERDKQEIAAANDALLAVIPDFDQVNPPVNEHQHGMASTSHGQTVTPEAQEITVDEVYEPSEIFSSSTEDSEEEEDCLRTQLAGWAIDNMIPHVALGESHRSVIGPWTPLASRVQHEVFSYEDFQRLQNEKQAVMEENQALREENQALREENQALRESTARAASDDSSSLQEQVKQVGTMLKTFARTGQSGADQTLMLRRLGEFGDVVRSMDNKMDTMLQHFSANVSVGELSLLGDLLLPLDTQEDLALLDNSLRQDKELQERFLRFLAIKCGRDLKTTVWRMLQSIFSNHLSINTTWTGVGDKACFRDMFLKTIVQRAIRKNPATQDATDEAIQVNVTRYLKGASDREGGKRRRTAERDPQPTP